MAPTPAPGLSVPTTDSGNEKMANTEQLKKGGKTLLRTLIWVGGWNISRQYLHCEKFAIESFLVIEDP